MFFRELLSDLAVAADNLISFYDEKSFEMTDSKEEKKDDVSSVTQDEDCNFFLLAFFCFHLYNIHYKNTFCKKMT